MISTSRAIPTHVIVARITISAGLGSAVMGMGAWYTNVETLQLSSVLFSLAYLAVAYASDVPGLRTLSKPVALFLITAHCCYVACGASLEPAPSFVLLPSLVAWLTLCQHRGILRVVGILHLGFAVAVAAGLLSDPGRYDVPWLSGVVLGFSAVTMVLASVYASFASRAYWSSMNQLELELQRSESSLAATTERLSSQRDELVAASFDLHAAVEANAVQIEELRFANEKRAQVARATGSDLKQPLRSITSFMQLITRRLERDGRAGEVREYLDFVGDGAARMNVMVNDLLRYSADPEQPDVQPVDTGLTLESIADNLRSLLDREGGSIQVAPGMPEVLGQGTQVLQLFQNLISNGIKFRHPTRGPECRVTHEVAPDGMIRFGVHDNGIGIPQNRLGDVFGLFTRLHEHGTYEGTGIGLATCRRIVIAAGGEIWAESEEGVGTSFYFTLPSAGEAVQFGTTEKRTTLA